MVRKKSIHELIKEKFGKNKLTDERFSKKKYWESIPQNDEGEPIEPIKANPDKLPETSGAWQVNLTDKQIEKLHAIDEAIDLLTYQERKIVELLGNGLSLDRAARKLGLSKSAGQSALIRAREKIQAFYSIRQAHS